MTLLQLSAIMVIAVFIGVIFWGRSREGQAALRPFLAKQPPALEGRKSAASRKPSAPNKTSSTARTTKRRNPSQPQPKSGPSKKRQR